MPKRTFSRTLSTGNIWLARLVARRPWITTAAVSTLLGSVLLILGVLKSGPVFITGDGGSGRPQIDSIVGNTRWKDVRLYEDNKVWTTLMFGLGTALISVVLVELAKNLGEQHSKAYLLRAFEQFFGEGAASRTIRGRIVLQADRIETLIEKLPAIDRSAVESVRTALKRPEKNRLHKARRWVNARDADSACIVRDGLRKAGFPTPDLQVIEHCESTENPFDTHSGAPYVISMGLAFTDTTTFLASKIGGDDKCFYIDDSTQRGDAIVVRGKFVHQEYDNLEVEEAKTQDRERRSKRYSYIFPKSWSLENWSGETQTSLEPAEKVRDSTGLQESNDLKDYAVIIRHTAKVGNRSQTRFILAGFTEDSTVHAGRYFVSRWEELWQKFVKDKPAEEGDFVVVISGNARTKQAWSSKPDIELSHRELAGVQTT